MPEPDTTSHTQAVAGLVDALAPLLVRRFRNQLYRALQPHCPIPLRDGTHPLLTSLRQGPADATTISEQVGVDRSVIIKQAAVLEQAGLLQRTRDPARPRIVVLHLTPAGQHAAEAAQTALCDLVATAEQLVSVDDLATTTRVLGMLNDHVTIT